MEQLEDRRLLATFSVSNTADSGPGSLRQAVLDANATPGDDLINVSVIDPILLTSGELVITDDVTIDGLVRGSNIDAGGTSRLFLIDDGTAATIHVEIGDLVMRGGAAEHGGAILNRESLLLRNVVATESSAEMDGGVIFNDGRIEFDGKVLVSNSAASRGGGIFNSGDAIISYGSISGNSATLGGGVYNVGTVTADDENFFEDAIDRGGLFGNTAEDGGGVFNDGVLELTETALSGNTALGRGGGIFNASAGDAQIVGSTISGSAAFGDGGGIYNDGSLAVFNSTITGNFAARGGGIYNTAAGGVLRSKRRSPPIPLTTAAASSTSAR